MIVSPARQRSRVSQLSDSERECLRLVLLHMTSKQIARRLGVSPHTVDARVRMAMKTLKASNRTEAALMLQEVEGDANDSFSLSGTLQDLPLVSQPAANQNLPLYSNDVDYADLEEEHHFALGSLNDHAAAMSLPKVPTQNSSLLPVFFGKTIPKNTMSPYSRLAVIVGICVASILTLSITISALQSLSSLYR